MRELVRKAGLQFVSMLMAAIVVSAKPAHADLIDLSSVDFATAYMDGAPTPWTFAPSNLGSIVNNGYAVFSSSVEFAVGALPTGVVVNSATLTGFVSNNPFDPCPEYCGNRSIQVHGYEGTGVVQLANFDTANLLGSRVIGTGGYNLSFDVTSFVTGLLGGGGSYAGFVWREDPAGPNSLMDLSHLNGPRLTIDYVVAPVPEPATYALLLAALGVHTLRQRRRRCVQSA